MILKDKKICKKNFPLPKCKTLIRLAILDWNELPREIKIKQDKKVSSALLTKKPFFVECYLFDMA